MKLLAIMGSPRRGGKVEQMMEAVCSAAEEAGHRVERVHLQELHLGGCTGCMRCRRSGECVLHDSIQHLKSSLMSCDGVILAAPTYFANVPGPVKNLFDRLSGAVMDENRWGIPRGRLSKKQKYVLLTACTTPPPFDRLCGQSTGALRAMNEFFSAAGMTRRGSAVFAGTKGKRDLPPRLVRKLQRFGRAF